MTLQTATTRPAHPGGAMLEHPERLEGSAGHGEILKGDPDRLEQGQIVCACCRSNPLGGKLEEVALDLLWTKGSFANRDEKIASLGECALARLHDDVASLHGDGVHLAPVPVVGAHGDDEGAFAQHIASKDWRCTRGATADDVCFGD